MKTTPADRSVWAVVSRGAVVVALGVVVLQEPLPIVHCEAHCPDCCGAYPNGAALGTLACPN
jgi:hypothetical protein